MLGRYRWTTHILIIACLLSAALEGDAAVPRDYSVELSANVETSPPRINLQWPQNSGASGYVIYRKQKHESGWAQIGEVGGSATGFTDQNVAVGSSFEYQVRKATSEGFSGYGFTYAGINAPAIEGRGKLVLVVDNKLSGPLNSELNRLMKDLVGDGWTVVRRDVSSSDSVQTVKDVIRGEYNSDRQNVRSVLLFGAIPVAYSGDINPDDHANHKGAWPADVFYGEMDGQWTDNSVNTTTAERAINHNVPGDGKFDQSVIPSNVDLEVGRVDLSNLTSFSNKSPARSELDLLRQYLNKDHRFRNKQFTVQRRGIICDSFGFRAGDPIVGSGWRNMTAILGQGAVQEVGPNQWLPAVTSGSYLMSWAAGGGSYYYSTGIATSDDFALNDIQVVFTMFLGSYYGDWNNESNFLRASLGSTSYTLTSSYAGYPHNLYHHMALGETIGYGIKLTQNHDGNTYPITNRAERQVHIALLGDPTLRAHPVAPPSNLNANATATGVNLSWNGSTDNDVVGYHVYRSGSEWGPFTRVTSEMVQGTTHRDAAPQGRVNYMLRAIKLERSGSGTYFNPSQGIFVSADSLGGGGGPDPSAIAIPGNFTAQATGRGSIALSWSDNSNNETEFQIDRRKEGEAFLRVATVPANTTSFNNTRLAPGTRYYYRIRAANSAAQSAFSPEVSATTQSDTVATPPVAPSGLVATALSHTQVKLTWGDNSSDETTFTLQRSSGGGAFADIAQPAANATSYIDGGLTPTTSYSYRIKANNAVGASAFSSDATIRLPAPPTATNPGSATFLRLDTATQGSWHPLYGKDGYILPGGGAAPPSFATVTPGGHTVYTWQTLTTDPRGLYESRTSTRRFVATWYGDPLTLEIRQNDSISRVMAMYFLDWDNSGRVQQVTIRDLITDQVLDTQTVRDFAGGKYLVWQVKGDIKVTIQKTAGPNALLNGLFFGENTTPANQDIRLSEIRYLAPGASFRISGPVGIAVLVEASDNGVTWSNIGSGTLAQGEMTFVDQEVRHLQHRFYRVRKQ